MWVLQHLAEASPFRNRLEQFVNRDAIYLRRLLRTGSRAAAWFRFLNSCTSSFFTACGAWALPETLKSAPEESGGRMSDF